MLNRTQFVCYLIAVSQLVLGILYLVWPAGFVAWQGLSAIDADIGYPLAMLAARFLVYGVGMIVIARDPMQNRIWLDGMIAIQLIDLLAGVFYVTTGAVQMADAAIPMMNAAAFVAMMVWVRPAASLRQTAAA